MRIGTIDIKASWSILLVGGILSLFLTTGYFPVLLPGGNTFAYLTAAFMCFLGLYASILLHELAHALVALKQGLKIKNIRLDLFGDISQLTEDSPGPRAGFWLAVVGPLTNLGLSAVFFGLANLPEPTISAIALYLMGVNLFLGIVNLIPAYPLDGGKVLQALVWGRTKNQHSATRMVTSVGRGIGLIAIGLGLFILIAGDFFDGLGLVLLGWFLIGAARQNEPQLLKNQSLQGMKVVQVMRSGDRALSPEVLLSKTGQFFFQIERGRVLPVVKQGYLLGTLSLEQLRKTSPAMREQLRVEKAMTRRGSLLGLRPDDDLQVAVDQMVAKPALYAAVIGEGGRFAGLLYLSDIPRFLEMQQLLKSRKTAGEPAAVNGLNGPTDVTTNPPQTPKLDKVA